jgi:hypothetical protein
MTTFGRPALDFFPHLNQLAAILCPKLMIENLPLYKRTEQVFMADIQDLGKGKL